MNFGGLDLWSHWTELNKIHSHVYNEVQSTYSVFAIKTFLSAFNVQIPNWKWAEHRQISNPDDVLNDLFVHNLTWHYAQSTIFF